MLKKCLIALFFILVISGCNYKNGSVTEEPNLDIDVSSSIQSESTSLTDNTQLSDPYCLMSWGEDFGEEKVRAVFADSRLSEGNRDSELLTKLFQNPEFVELKEKSSPLQLCILNNGIGFAFYKSEENDQKYSYSETENLNNVIGLMTYEGKLVTDYQYISGGGDIGQCVIVGYLDGVLYRCNGGDGPFGFSKVFLLKPDGSSLTVRDCEHSGPYSDGTTEFEEKIECKTDLLGSYGDDW